MRKKIYIRNSGGLFAVQSVAMSLGGLAYPLISTIYMDTLNIYPAAIYLVTRLDKCTKRPFLQNCQQTLSIEVSPQVMVGVMIIALALTLATHLKLINMKGKCS